MRTAIAGFVADGFTHVAFGDLFLEDVRKYREDRLAGTGPAADPGCSGNAEVIVVKFVCASGLFEPLARAVARSPNVPKR